MWIFARQHGGDGKSGRVTRGHVLHGMDRDVRLAAEQCLLDFLDEESLPPGFHQRPILDAVARGAESHDRANLVEFALIPAMRIGERGPYEMRLGKRQG